MLATSRKKVIDAATIRIFEKLSSGWTDEQVRRDLNVAPESYKVLKRLMLEGNAAEIRAKPQDHIFVEYVLEQRGTIRKLDKVVKELKGSNQYNAMIGALRLRADLVDRVLERSQEFGIVKKEPERKMITGVLVQDMSNADLMSAIREQVESFQAMSDSYGDRPFLSLPSRPTHYGPRAKTIEATGEAVEAPLDEDEEDDEKELIHKKKSKPKK